MKTLRISTLLSFMAIFLAVNEMNAQRRVVVKTPHRTVVRTPRAKVVYRNPAPAVRVVRTVPRTAVVVNYGGLRYHYSAGVYYRYYNGRYVVVSAPIGLRVRILPVGYRLIYVGPRAYYYYQGSYYIKVEGTDEYETVEAPTDAVVHTLPEDTEEVEIDGKTFYEYNGILYKVVTTPEGKAFKVTGKLED